MDMKLSNALRTAAESLDNAARALKPAIGDLAATHDDYQFESMCRLYLSLTTRRNAIGKSIQRIDQTGGELESERY
jgi:hypothetical protein